MASHFIILVCLALCTTGVMCSRIRRPTRTTTLPTTPPTTPPTAANFNAWAISPPSDQCSHSGYDSTRSPVERVHDATYLYMRQLKKLTYQIPHNVSQGAGLELSMGGGVLFYSVLIVSHTLINTHFHCSFLKGRGAFQHAFFKNNRRSSIPKSTPAFALA